MPQFEGGTQETKESENGNGQSLSAGIGRRIRLEFDLKRNGNNGHSRFSPTNIALSFEEERAPKRELEELDFGSVMEITAPTTEFTKFRSETVLSLAELNLGHVPWITAPANQCLHIMSEDKTRYALAIYKKEASALRFVSKPTARNRYVSIVPRNIEQALAMGCLLDPEIKLVSLIGTTGSGKTLLALTAWWRLAHGVRHESFRGNSFDIPEYSVPGTNIPPHLVVRRPTVGSSRELGFLPGSADEKFGPFGEVIEETLNHIRATFASGDDRQTVAKVGPLNFDRGRNIRNAFLVGDDAQNWTAGEVELLVTRADCASKVVLTGDPWQIDTPGLTYTTNGLIVMASRLRDSELTACVRLKHCMRGPLAALVAERFGHG